MTESSSTALFDGVAATWQLDPTSTTIEIHTKAMWGMVKVKGTFSAVSGGGAIADNGAISGELVVDAASIDTGHTKRDKHLRSADFFEVDTHPTFMFTAAEATTSPNGTVKVKGALRIKDQSHPVEFVVTSTKLSPERVIVNAEGTIDRSQWGMIWKKGASFVNQVIVMAQFVRS